MKITNLVSYTILLIGYMKYVHNRPIPLTLSEFERAREMTRRNRLLGSFVLFGAPMTIICIRLAAVEVKDIFGINFTPFNENNNANTSSSLLVFLSKITKYIPTWLKIVFSLFSLVILILKLFGYNFIDLFIDYTLLKNVMYGYASVVIIYILLDLYLLHKFSTSNFKIPEILPQFIINWLRDIEGTASSKVSLDVAKETNYIHLLIYIISIIIVTIIL